jgi:hypothetical protein
VDDAALPTITWPLGWNVKSGPADTGDIHNASRGWGRMPGKIFVNYRRDDAAGDARGVRDALAAKFGEASVFMDVDNLRPGQRFDVELAKALDACDVFLAVIGPRWMDLLRQRYLEPQYDYVRAEIAAALQRGINVIPVRVGRDGNMPRLPAPNELPDDLRPLVLHQKHDVVHERFRQDVADLISAIEALRKFGDPEADLNSALEALGKSLAVSSPGTVSPATRRSERDQLISEAIRKSLAGSSPGEKAWPFDPSKHPRVSRRAAAIWFALLAVIAIGALVASWRDQAPGRQPAAAIRSDTSSRERDYAIPPLVGFSGSEQAINSALQATPLWRTLKRDFPDWYAGRVKEAAALAAQKKDDTAIGQQMAHALVLLRRQNVNYALSASFPKLKAVAVTFYDNVVELQKQSNDVCFEFISQGEASPTVIGLLQGSPHVARLQAQLTAVFEAIADGRATARTYPHAYDTDYTALRSDLTRRGWVQSDFQLFNDLAKAGSVKVCQLVRDMFAAQLAITDGDRQLRLLVESLKPILAG